MDRNVKDAIEKLEKIAKARNSAGAWRNYEFGLIRGAKDDVEDIKKRLSTMSGTDAVFMNFIADRFNEISERLEKVQNELSELKSLQEQKFIKNKDKTRLIK